MRNHIKLILLFWVLYLLTSLTLIFGEEISKIISKEPLWKNKKEVKLTHIFTIGHDDYDGDENYYFAFIRDIAIDKYGNLYVLAT